VGWLGAEYRVLTKEDSQVLTTHKNAIDGEQVETVIDTHLMYLTCTTITFVSGSSVDFTFSGSPDLSSVSANNILRIFRGCNSKNRGSWVIVSVDNVNKKIRASVYGSSAANNQAALTAPVEIHSTIYADSEATLRFNILKQQRYLCTFSTPVYNGLPGDMIQISAGRYELTAKNIQVLKINTQDNLVEIEGWF
jgi:hypothetical protein